MLPPASPSTASSRNTVNSAASIHFFGDHFQAELLLDDTRDSASHSVLLPGKNGAYLADRGTLITLKQSDKIGFFAGLSLTTP
jgi:hypothetical protein